MKLNKGYLYLLAAAASYASMGILVKFLSNELTPLWQTCLRLLFSALLAFIYLVSKKQKPFLTHKNLWPHMIFMGVVAYGSSVLAYTYAFNFTSIANIYFILSTYPVFAAFIAVPVLSEKIIRKDILALFILTIGLIIIFNPTDLYRDLTGNVLAMYVAITFALYVIISRYLSSKNESAETITFLSIGVGALATTVPALLFESIPHTISSASIVGVLIFGLLNFIAHILVNIGFKTIKASTGTMVLMLEAVMGTVLAMLFFAEMPTLMFMSGAFLILAAVYISVKS